MRRLALTAPKRRPTLPFLIACWLLPVAVAAAGGLPRVMSTNLCADLLLLSVAAPEQIVSLSRASRDPSISPIADAAAAYPANEGGVEEILYRQPDIALVYRGWSGGRFETLLAHQDIEIVSVPYPKDWEDALATTRAVATRVGRAEQGVAIAAAAERRMRVLAQQLPPLRALYLRPGGGSAGTGTYVDDVLERLGLRNLAAEAGHAGWGAVPLEAILLAAPDVFLLGYFEQEQALTASAYARHPVLKALLARTPQVQVPSRLWGCGGVELVDAAEAIAAQVEALNGAKAP